MKKWAYLLGGFVIGAVVVASGDTVVAQVKSLVGQKVTGEYKVIVNGTEFQDKGAVISGRTNAPVRAISDSIGADLKVDNKSKTITITTEEKSINNDTNSNKESENEISRSKQDLLNSKSLLESELERLNSNKLETEKKLSSANEGTEKSVFEQALGIVNEKIEQRTQELNEINAQLAALNK